jgi:hypothetical protein
VVEWVEQVLECGNTQKDRAWLGGIEFGAGALIPDVLYLRLYRASRVAQSTDNARHR